jgi:uncharacterized repeat protein (TIGR03847 family)
MSVWYEFEELDAFTTGAIGRPGERTFYLQVRAGAQHIAIKCEKQQVAAIAGYLEKVLVDLPPPQDRPVAAALELRPPVESEFILGTIGLGYEPGRDRIVIQFDEMVPTDEEGSPLSDDQGQIRIHISRGQALAFCEHATEVVAAGRPPCRWCQGPIDPDGHACPRMN